MLTNFCHTNTISHLTITYDWLVETQVVAKQIVIAITMLEIPL